MLLNSSMADTDSAKNSEVPTCFNHAAIKIIEIVNYPVLSGIICLVGIVFNVINMIIFIQQGLTNTVNISMFAISVSDFCSLITLEWLNINLNPFMESADLPYEPSEIQYLTGGWPHACFLQITIWITVYVTAERFLCVAFPLKVKSILTPNRTKLILVFIVILMFMAFSPEYLRLYFGEKFFPSQNKTKIGIKERNTKFDLKKLEFLLSAVILTISFIALIVFTCLLVVILNRRSQWRKQSTADGDKSQSMTKRDKKTMKMVGLIAGVLIICATPGMCLSIVVVIVPEFNLEGQYSHLVHTTWSVAFLCEAVNSTVHILFFYKMSTAYKTVFHALFKPCCPYLFRRSSLRNQT